MVPTPKPWLPSFHPGWRPASPFRGSSGVRSAGRKGVVNLPPPEIPGRSLPLASP